MSSSCLPCRCRSADWTPGGAAHHLLNRTSEDVVYLEVGDRLPGDEVTYPDDDLRAVPVEGGGWRMVHKDGTPY
jgi:uncharacterized cupin superfamily protein